MIPSNPATLNGVAMFVLAGGLGSRLSPLTQRRPKPLFSVAGHFRAIDFPLSNALDSGSAQVHVITQHLASQIEDYLNTGWTIEGYPQFAIPVCAPPGSPYRGTTEAITRNLHLAGNRCSEIVTLSADHVYQMDYADLVRCHREYRADVTVATTLVPAEWASSLGLVTVDDDDRLLSISEKPMPSDLTDHQHHGGHGGHGGHEGQCLVNMGIYVFSPECLASLDASVFPDLGPNALPELIRTRTVHAYRFDRRAPRGYRYWNDIGTFDNYFAAHQDLIDGWAPFVSEGSVRSGMTANHRNPSWLEGSFFMSASANVDSTEIYRSVIGAGAQVGRNAHVINSILMPGARVGEDAVVRNAIVDEYAVVPDGDSVGLDRQADRCRHFVTDQGLVVVAAPQETGSGERQGTGSGIVLVADSDSDYLEWARFVLENEGHEVLTVQSAELLMAVVVRHRAKIRVAICGSLEHDTIRAASRLLVDNLQHALLILRDEPGQQADTIVPASSVFGLLTEPANPGQLVTMVDEALNRTRSRSAVS